MDFTALMRFDNPTQAYPAYKRMCENDGKEPMGFTATFIPWWEGLKGLARGASAMQGRRHIPTRQALETSVALVNQSRKENATMATTTTRKRSTRTTTKREGRLTSPFLLDDADEAYEAYKQMPHTKSPNASVMNKRQFMKAYPERHAKAIAKQNKAQQQATTAPTTVQGQSIADVLGDAWQDADEAVVNALLNAGYVMPEQDDDTTTDEPDPSIIAALAHNAVALNAYLAQFGGTATTSTAQRSNAKRYRQRTNRADLPGGGNAYDENEDEAPASNAVLWALHTEGLLRRALDQAGENGDVLGTDNAPDEPYITQAAGKALLEATFGPLPARTTA